MKLFNYIAIPAIALTCATYANADKLPPRSSNYQGNYETLTKDQKADDQLAQCIATGHDLIAKDKYFDRLGFTAENMAQTTRLKSKEKKAEKLDVRGEARSRKSGGWSPVQLTCNFSKGKISGIKLSELKPHK